MNTVRPVYSTGWRYERSSGMPTVRQKALDHTHGSPIMSDKARDSKIDDTGLRLLRNLEQRNAVEFCHIRREVFTGGKYRRVMIEQSDAMLAIGGGKGTYTAGTKMTALGKPVLPLDLQLGSTAEDGEGAVALNREMTTEPDRFFPSPTWDLSRRDESKLGCSPWTGESTPREPWRRWQPRCSPES